MNFKKRKAPTATERLRLFQEIDQRLWEKSVNVHVYTRSDYNGEWIENAKIEFVGGPCDGGTWEPRVKKHPASTDGQWFVLTESGPLKFKYVPVYVEDGRIRVKYEGTTS